MSIIKRKFLFLTFIFALSHQLVLADGWPFTLDHEKPYLDSWLYPYHAHDDVSLLHRITDGVTLTSAYNCYYARNGQTIKGKLLLQITRRYFLVYFFDENLNGIIHTLTTNFKIDFLGLNSGDTLKNSAEGTAKRLYQIAQTSSKKLKLDKVPYDPQERRRAIHHLVSHGQKNILRDLNLEEYIPPMIETDWSELNAPPPYYEKSKCKNSDCNIL